MALVARQRFCSNWEKIITDVETRALRKQLNEQVWPLFLFPFALLALNIFPIANTIYSRINPDDPSLVLWMLQAVFSPLQGAYIALVYMLDRETIKRLKYSNIKAAIRKGNTTSEYPVEVGPISDSANSRDRSLVAAYNQYNVWAVNPASISIRRNQSYSIIHNHQVVDSDSSEHSLEAEYRQHENDNGYSVN